MHAELDLITLHLGNGASVAAIRGGRSVDTSMGMTPLEGLVMGTRCGDIDPAVPMLLGEITGRSRESVHQLMNSESGLLGLTGESAIREVHRLADAGDEDARLALEMFCYRAKKYVGAYYAALGRADAVVFTAGIGEHDPDVRSRICAGLERLGIELDAEANAANAGDRARDGSAGDGALPGECFISVPDSEVAVLVIPTDEEGRLLINFRGPEKTFPHYSVSDVLDGTVPKEALKDKIVLVGPTAIGIYDMRVTPFSGTFPGVEIHANVIDNILKNDAISRPQWISLFDVGAILLIGIVLSVVMNRLTPVVATLFTLGLLAAYAMANEYIFTYWKVWLTAIYPGMTMVFVFGGVTTFRILTEEKKKKEIRDAFSRYVAPSLVTDILKDPSRLVLGGEERRLTVFFSDIRGFTTISEGLTPPALVKLINDYLTPMTDIILKSGGTVDKYMGDAIMAFWGAPVWQEDHAVRAANTALEMMEKLRLMQTEWEKQGIPRLDIGIGLSTGRLTVGNMGSHMRFDYTVMGDSVNLGSRLEGLNKEYSTHIIVPKFTYEDIKQEFILRKLDHIRVKGKKVPIKIYELMGRKDAGDKLREVAGLFEEGLAAYMARDWDKAEARFQKTLGVIPGDGPSTVFLNRVKNMRETELPEDWDGVCVMKTK